MAIHIKMFSLFTTIVLLFTVFTTNVNSEYVRNDSIDCWRSKDQMSNADRYIGAMYFVTKEVCQNQCDITDGCNVVFQYEYSDADRSSCYLMRRDHCLNQKPKGPSSGWYTWMKVVNLQTQNTPTQTNELPSKIKDEIKSRKVKIRGFSFLEFEFGWTTKDLLQHS